MFNETAVILYHDHFETHVGFPGLIFVTTFSISVNHLAVDAIVLVTFTAQEEALPIEIFADKDEITPRSVTLLKVLVFLLLEVHSETSIDEIFIFVELKEFSRKQDVYYVYNTALCNRIHPNISFSC